MLRKYNLIVKCCWKMSYEISSLVQQGLESENKYPLRLLIRKLWSSGFIIFLFSDDLANEVFRDLCAAGGRWEYRLSF